MEIKLLVNELFTPHNKELMDPEVIAMLREKSKYENVVQELNSDPDYKKRFFKRIRNNIINPTWDPFKIIKDMDEVDDIEDLGRTLDYIITYNSKIKDEVYEFIKQNPKIDKMGSVLGGLVLRSNVSKTKDIWSFIENNPSVDGVDHILFLFINNDLNYDEVFKFIKNNLDIKNLGYVLSTLLKEDKSKKEDILILIKENPEIDNIGEVLSDFALELEHREEVFQFVKANPRISNLGKTLRIFLDNDIRKKEEIWSLINHKKESIDNIDEFLNYWILHQSLEEKYQTFCFIKDNLSQNNLRKTLCRLIEESEFIEKYKSDVLDFMIQNSGMNDLYRVLETFLNVIYDEAEYEKIFVFITSNQIENSDKVLLALISRGFKYDEILEMLQKRGLKNLDEGLFNFVLNCRRDEKLLKDFQDITDEKLRGKVLSEMNSGYRYKVFKIIKENCQDEKLFKKVRNFYLVDKIKNNILSIIRLLDLDNDDFYKIEDELDNFLNNLSYTELKFFEIILEKNNFLSHEVFNMLLGKYFSLEAHKDGGKLFVDFKENEKRYIQVVNEIEPKYFEAWKALHDAGVPVAPILEFKEIKKDGKTMIRVRSRFCGQTLSQILEQGIEVPDFIYYKIEALKEKRNQIVEYEIEQHDSYANIAIEFIKKQHYNEQISKGCNVNTIPCDLDAFKIDFEEHIYNDKYKYIIRFIDLDLVVLKKDIDENDSYRIMSRLLFDKKK